MAFTPDELSWLHTILEGRAEVIADDSDGDTAEADRVAAMINDNPVISAGDADWILEHAQDFDDEPAVVTLREKLAALIEAYKELTDFYLRVDDENEDTPEILAEQLRLFDLVRGLNGDTRV